MYNIGIIVNGNNDARGAMMAKLAGTVIPNAKFSTINLHATVRDYWVAKKNTKSVREIGPHGPEAFAAYFGRIAGGKKYDGFICIDEAFAHHTLPEKDTKALNGIDVLSGMLHEVHGAPVLFVMDPLHTYGRMHSPEYHAAHGYMIAFHLQKLHNVLRGMPVREKPTKFFIPTGAQDLKDLENMAAKSDLIAFDIETSGGYVSVIGFACERHDLDYTPMFVVPLFINIEGTDGRYWNDDITFNFALDTIGRILANDVPKVAHNGSFDVSWLFRYGWHVQNFIFDTMHLFHAMFPTIPKALYRVSSMFVHSYRFWKDDGKEVDDDGKTKWEAPKTADRTYGYWAYNALDCANTLEAAIGILDYLNAPRAATRYPMYHRGFDHVWRTYVREFALQFGPALYMSMHGLPVPEERQTALRDKLNDEADKNLEELRYLLGDEDFNPNSTPQVRNLLYNGLGIKPLARKGESTDKTITQTFADMHPIYATVINAVRAAKEPANNASKYGRLPLHHGRWMYKLKAGNTTTTRLASSKHDFAGGTNMQNVPKPMRLLAAADKGHILVSSDYAQSDSYFVAFESQDETMIETVTDDRDTHSVHVEFFFGHKYEDVVAGANAKPPAPWVVHPVTGVRQIIKKVSHGTNYDMGGDTMLLNVRKDAAIAMVNALLSGPNVKAFRKFMELDPKKPSDFYIGNSGSWSSKQLARACEFAQNLYYMRYPTMKTWKGQAVAQARMDGGVINMFGGSTTVMLCDPSKNARFVPASYGQGGTAGNINNAMLRLYFLADQMWREGFRMIIQIHDELVCSVPDGCYHLVAQKVAIMESPCTIHGRTFTVPVEAEMTRSWQAKWTTKFKGLDKADILTYDKSLDENEQAVLKSLGLLTT